MATKDNVQGVVLALFGASAGGHLAGLTASATANGLTALAGDLAASAGFILGKDLSTAAAFRENMLTGLGISSTNSAYAAAAAWADAELAKPNANRGEIVATAVNYLAGLTDSTSPYYAAATAYKATVAAAVAWSEGAGATVFGVAALQAQQGTSGAAGSTFTLSTETTDYIIGTAGNDTIVAATSTDDATDNIIDISSTDKDVLNWSLTASPAAVAAIKNVETINLTTATASDLTFDMTNVSGTSAVNVVRNDYLNGKAEGTGTMDIDAALGAATYTFGAQVDDAEVNFNADGSLAAAINTSADLKTLLVDNVGQEGVTIVAARTGVAVTLDGLGDTDADGVANDAASLAAFGKASLTLTNGGDVVENITISGNGAALELDLTGDVESITLTGSQDITLTSSAAELTGEKLVNKATGTTKIVADTTGTLDLKSFALVSNVVLGTDFNSKTVTVNSGQLVTTSKDQNGAANALTIAAAVTTAAAVKTNTVTFATTDNEVTDSGVAFDDLVFTNYATVNLDATAETITGVDLTASGAKVVVTGGNAVKFTGVTTAKTVDATAATAAITLTLAAAAATVSTGSGKDSLTTGAGGVIAADLGNGDNTLDINAVDAGSSFVTGTGKDTVTLDGVNTLTLSTGAGNDKITVSGAADASIDAGEGTDTIVIDGAGDIDVSALDNFNVAGAEIVSLADGLKVTVAQFAGISKAEIAGTAAKVLTITGAGTTAKTIDASGLTVKVGTTSTVSIIGSDKGDTITGTDAADAINGGAGADVITGGAGVDTITIDAAGTGIFTAGEASAKMTTVDKVYVEASDSVDLTGLVATQASYDALETIQTSGTLDLTITAGKMEQVKGIYDAATDTFTVSNASGANAVLVYAAATDAGTTATDAVLLVGVTSLTDLENGIITV